jgi:hypothetical protein
MLHEALNSIHRKKQSALLFKVDFEKAYDKIKNSKTSLVNGVIGLCTLCSYEAISSSFYAVPKSDVNTREGLRQGDALSPLLFDLAADALAIILERARNNGFVKGVLSENLNNRVNMLQYADDTIFLLQDDEDSARILSLF